uniref:Uncharacterized protein n=1 Tax=uncultured SAR11 cluster alpha proteobacterium H17925_45G17 TaxID=715038 RepID=E7CA26_9PROT|nr:hypothetical protein [uncultured SAR11 cluster alpha proteobacterium H17925_45G17]
MLGGGVAVIAAGAFSCLHACLAAIVTMVIAALCGGFWHLSQPPATLEEVVKARFVVNCAGLGSDKIARMVSLHHPVPLTCF